MHLDITDLRLFILPWAPLEFLFPLGRTEFLSSSDRQQCRSEPVGLELVVADESAEAARQCNNGASLAGNPSAGVLWHWADCSIRVRRAGRQQTTLSKTE